MSSTGRIAARSAERNTSLWRTSPESAGNAGRPSLSRLTPLAGQNIARNVRKSGQQGKQTRSAEEKGHKIYFNKVHYYDEKVDWADIFISLIQGTYNIAFWKRKAYSNQQEFRIVIPVEDYTEDHIELDP